MHYLAGSRHSDTARALNASRWSSVLPADPRTCSSRAGLPAAPPPGGRRPARATDLHVRKVKFYLHIGPYRPAAGRQGADRPLPGGRGIKL